MIFYRKKLIVIILYLTISLARNCNRSLCSNYSYYIVMLNLSRLQYEKQGIFLFKFTQCYLTITCITYSMYLKIFQKYQDEDRKDIVSFSIEIICNLLLKQCEFFLLFKYILQIIDSYLQTSVTFTLPSIKFVV